MATNQLDRRVQALEAKQRPRGIELIIRTIVDPSAPELEATTASIAERKYPRAKHESAEAFRERLSEIGQKLFRDGRGAPVRIICTPFDDDASVSRITALEE